MKQHEKTTHLSFVSCPASTLEIQKVNQGPFIKNNKYLLLQGFGNPQGLLYI